MDGTLTPRPATFALGSNDRQPSRGSNKNLYITTHIPNLYLAVVIALFYSNNLLCTTDLFVGINLYEFNKNDGTLIQHINGARKMNRWLQRQLDTLSADGESIVVVTKT